MPGTPHALLVDLAGPVADLPGLLHKSGLRADRHNLPDTASEKQLSEADAAVVSVDWENLNGQMDDVIRLIQTLTSRNIATLVLGVPSDANLDVGPLVELVPSGTSEENIAARVGTFARYAPMIRRLDRELDHLQRLGKRLNSHFADIDQELRLAGRLQRDFLPPKLPQIPPLRFETYYHPASWVSGDMFDVFRIDEQHVGLFVADAVGHGLAAGLLTMFLRQSLSPKRIGVDTYELIEPADAMNNLHQALVDQALPNCWFVTASYLIVNIMTLEVTHARGGHPYPLHISADGQVRELQASGGLLGLPEIEANFEQKSCVLSGGDKIMLYTDGIEPVIIKERHVETSEAVFFPEFLEWARLPAREMLDRIGDAADRAEGSLNHADDMTAVVLEVAG